MRCEHCNARMVPHTNIDAQTVFICPIDGSAVYCPEGYEPEIEDYWFSRSELSKPANVVPFPKH